MLKSFIRGFFDSDLKIAVLLFIIAVLAYWEISLLQFSVHNVMLDEVLPWRFHVGECLRHNIFPFWNPYQATGYPIHADLVSGTFYPETLIIGAVFGYSNITLHILFIVYVFFAGLGMYRLLKHFGAIHFAAFITGAAFMLSGIFVSHVQHFPAIISFTWIPWVLLYYLRLSEDPWNFRHILPLSLFSFLMISGGYKALSVIMGYLMMTLFIVYIVTCLIRKNHKQLIRLVLSNLAWLGILALFSAVLLVSTWNIYDYVERISDLTKGETLYNSVTPRSLISLFAPFGMVKSHEFLQTDLSTANMYMGVIMLAFFVTGLVRKQTRVVYVLLIFGTIAMLAAFGDHLPVRQFLVKYFPMMDMVRLPAYFRFFMVLPVFVIAGRTLSDLLKDPEKIRKLFALSLLIVGIGIMATFGYSASQITESHFVFLDSSLSLGEKLQQAPIVEYAMFHGLLNLVLFTAFFLFLYYKVMNMRLLLVLFIFVEMLIAVQLNITYTGCSTDWHPVKIRSELRMDPEGFPVTHPGKISENTDKAYTFQPFWRNVNIFNKTVSFDCFSSFKFAGYNYLRDSVPELKEAVLQNPPVYLSDEIYRGSALETGDRGPFSSKAIFAPDEVYEEYETLDLRSDSSDRVTINSFAPGQVSASVSSRYPQLLTLLQSDYKGWEVLVDGNEVPHFTSNRLYISLLLEEGEHEVLFQYKNNSVKAGFVVSYSTLLFVLFLMAWQLIETRYNGRRLPLFLVSFSVILLILAFKAVSISRSSKSEKVYLEEIEDAMEWEKNQPGKTSFIFVVDNLLAFRDATAASGTDFQYDLYQHATPENIMLLLDDVDRKPGEYLYYAGIRSWKRHETWPVLMNGFPGLIRHSVQPNSEVFILGKEEPGDSIWIFEAFNDFETPDTAWFGYDRHLDSSFAFSGVVSNRLDSAVQYSHTVSIQAADIPVADPVFHLSAMIYPEKDCRGFLVIEVRREDELLGYYTRAIHEAVELRDDWTRVIFSAGTNVRLRPGDEIKAFIWNDSRVRLWVDDISLRIGESLY